VHDEPVSALNTHLYPDLAEQGGLGPAWQNAARRAGVELDIGWRGFGRLKNAYVVTPRGTVELHLVGDKRAFGLLIHVADRDRVWGTTDDLEQAALVAAAWRDGSTTRELIAAFRFMSTDRIAQAEEDGNLHEVLWSIHLEDPGYAGIRPVLRAAHDVPQLRRLYPSVTHETLARFTVDHRDRSNGQVAIMCFPDHYEVDSSWQSVTESVPTLAEAIAIAASQVPDSLGG